MIASDREGSDSSHSADARGRDSRLARFGSARRGANPLFGAECLIPAARYLPNGDHVSLVIAEEE